jgi:regulator of protease activity HflC (stomatin/prohibitin superfamily)
MGQLIVSVIFALIVGGGVALLFGGLMVTRSRRREPISIRPAIFSGLIVSLATFATLAALDSYTQVQYGTVAVVTQFGRVVGEFQPGLNWKLPFIQDTIVYRTQEIVYETSEDPNQSDADYPDYQVDTATADGQQIQVRFTIRFRIRPDRASDIAQNLGPEARAVEKVIKAESRSIVRNTLKRYTASQLYSGNVEAAQEAIAEILAPRFAANGLELTFFGLRSIVFSDAYKQAVENKQIEAENIITKQNLAKQAEFEKQRRITEAEAEAEAERVQRIGIAQGEAEAIKLRAQAEAEAIRIRAEAQAEANLKIAASLTPEMLSWQAIQNWNGQLPPVVGSGASVILPGSFFQPPASPLPAPTTTP